MPFALLLLIFIAFSPFLSYAKELVMDSNNSHAIQIQKLPDDMNAAELLLPLQNDRVIGNKNANIIMIEYASMSCLHCSSFNLHVMPKIKEKYIDTGKVLFIYRDFPFDYRSLKAAMLGFCYTDFDYFNYQKAVFSSVDSWSSKPSDLGVLENIAKISNISTETFNKCINNEEVMNYIIQQKFLATKQLMIGSTPTFFVNGKKIEGSKDFKFFAEMFDELIKNKPNYSPIIIEEAK